MFIIDKKEYRNLQEQVLKNKQDIAAHYATDRVLADFGIRIIGRVDTPEDIETQPIPAGGYQYGDAYAVGEEGTIYDYYIYTRPFDGEVEDQWFDIGSLTIAGPQGPKGDKGDKGDTGASTKWIYAKYVANLPSAALNKDLNLGDLALVSSGDILVLVEVDGVRKWGYTNINIKGSKGDKGDTGIGIQGPPGDAIVGPAGPRGLGLVILGKLTGVNALPDPSMVRRDGAYIVNVNGVQHFYAITGTDTLEWEDLGVFSIITEDNTKTYYKHHILLGFSDAEYGNVRVIFDIYNQTSTPYTPGSSNIVASQIQANSPVVSNRMVSNANSSRFFQPLGMSITSDNKFSIAGMVMDFSNNTVETKAVYRSVSGIPILQDTVSQI